MTVAQPSCAKLNAVNPVLLRAYALRTALALVALAVFVGVVASSQTDPPWPFLLPVLVAILTYGVIASAVGDRKLAIRAGRGDAPWNGTYASWTQQTSATPVEVAASLAAQAISDVGGRNVELDNNLTAVGWIGSNFPFWQEYQLAVVVSIGTEGLTTFTCCARPRRRR